MASAKEVLKEITSDLLTVVLDVNHFYGQMNKLEKHWHELLEKFKGIGQLREIESGDKGKVITLYDAKVVVETLRAENLAQRAKQIFGKVQEQFDIFLFLLKGGTSGASDAESKLAASLVPRSAQFFDRAQKVVLAIFQILDAADALLISMGEIIDLLDILKTAERELDKKALNQNRKINYISVRYQFQSRTAPKGNPSKEVNPAGTAAALTDAKRALSIDWERALQIAREEVNRETP